MSANTFKVGDRVRVREGGGCEDFYPDGAAGAVTTVTGGGGCWVTFDEDSGAKNVNGRTWFSRWCDLESEP